MGTTKLSCVLPLLLGANPRQAVSRPISIIASKSVPSFRNIQIYKDEGCLGGVGETGIDLMGDLDCEGGHRMAASTPNSLLKCNSDGRFDEAFQWTYLEVFKDYSFPGLGHIYSSFSVHILHFWKLFSIIKLSYRYVCQHRFIYFL